MDAYLHLHSEFSLLDGTASAEALCERASRLGVPAVALADTDNAYGHVRFLRAARERSLKPLLGARVTDPDGAGDAVCLARTREGYADLCRLITARQLEEGFRLADALPRLAAGLVVLTRHATLLERLSGRLEKATLFAELVPWRGETHRTLLATARAVGVSPVATPEVRFLDVSDWELHRVLCAVREGALVSRLRPAQTACEGASFPAPAAFRARFAAVPEALASAAAIAAACEPGLELGRVRFPRFPLPAGAADARTFLASRCEAGLRRRYGPRSRPSRPAVDGRDDRPAGAPSADAGGAASDPERDGLPAGARERLAYELDVIHDLGFDEYFLVVWDIVRFCAMKGIPCVGRGSAASSLVAWALGITNVDPIRYDLPFERFLHRSRTDVPDIDLDLCWRRRDEVLAYVYRTYGDERTAMISTHTTFQTRLAFREAAKAYGIPNDLVNRLSRGLPYHAVPGEPAERMARLYGRAADVEGGRRQPTSVRRTARSSRNGNSAATEDVRSGSEAAGRESGPPARAAGGSLLAAIRRTPECRGFPIDEEPWPTVLRLAERMVGLPRHLGIHPGGVVIGREPLTRDVPLEMATKGIVVTQPEMDAIEELGLVKMDLLGQRALTTIGDTLALLRRRTGTAPDLDRIPDPDPATAALLRVGRTISCFQIESPGMRGLMRMLAVESSDELIAALSLIRPGPAAAGMKDRFIRRRRGEEPVDYPHPTLEPLLRDTYGIMLYQEDIMRVAHATAGFTLEEADRLRRDLEAGRTRLQVNRVAHDFFRRAVASALDEGTAWGLWEQMKQFMGYAFCKAHAATYGVLAYQATYLKAHHPLEFYVAVLNNHQGMYPRRAHVEEAKRTGLRFLGPDVNRSGVEYEIAEAERTWPLAEDPDGDGDTTAADSSSAAMRGDVAGPAIRIPVTQVRGLAAESAARIVEGRRWGPYLSVRDFAGRSGVSRDELEALVKCGALDCLGRSRTSLLLEARLVGKAPAAARAVPLEGERLALVAGGGDGLRVPDLPQPEPERALAWELEVLGLTVREHPLALFRSALPPDRVAAADVAEAPPGVRLRTAGIAIASRHHPTENGEPMVFLTLEDEGGVVETTLFPAAYRRWGHLLEDAGPFVAEGTVDRHHGVSSLTVEKLERV
ncbi:MAG TPA: DNA polymerase III subunit alpha [Gemmatimonadota bacterium]|jgi:DNA polymerase-3 subunit alpha